MAWYKTGTVSIVNGATSVSGTGTRFAANARVGDGFRGPDGEWYEILNIASETTLGIFPAYSGATVSLSSEYMIAPLQGYNKETADRLRIVTDGMSDISGDVEAAQVAAAAALNSETNAQSSEDAAKVSELAAKTSETNSALSEANASASELVSLNSATAASNSEQAAALSETNALASENAAKVSEDAALASELAAQASASSASISETNAKASEDAAKVSELAAKASELSADEDATTATTAATSASNSMTAAQTAQTIAEQARDDAIEAAGTVTGNLMDQGPWDASTGVYPTKPAVSSFWKVTGNGSATDAGETISYGIGDTLMFSKPLENFYKIDNTESVSSVNGHTGVVVLEKSDIGLSNVDNTSDIDKPISTATQTALNGKEPIITILPINKGGTGSDTQAGARLGLGLKSAAVADVVGTVSEAGGVSTGAIIESGSNINGDYVKYADGTQVCRYIHNVRLITTSSQGSIYLSPTGQQLTYPMPFVSPPAVAPCPTYDAVGAGRAWLSNNQPTTTGVLMISHGPTNTASCYPGYIAIGRWY